jgi:DNA-binding transcriptional ArsR family regulator
MTKALNEKAYSKYFKAFGDPTRLRILFHLASGELMVNQIVKAVGLSQPVVSRHLAILREANAVISRRDGQRIYYRLNKVAVGGCCDGFCNCLAIQVVPSDKRKKK